MRKAQIVTKNTNENQPITLRQEDWTQVEWAVILKLFNFSNTDRIFLDYSATAFVYDE